MFIALWNVKNEFLFDLFYTKQIEFCRSRFKNNKILQNLKAIRKYPLSGSLIHS